MNVTSQSLEAEQDENLPRALLQRLQRLADERAGAVDRHAAQLQRLRAHGDAGRVAGDEQVADADGRARRIDLDLDAARRGDKGLALARFAERDAGLRRDDAGDARVVGDGAGGDVVVVLDV
jgi:hypothetical protein